MNIFLVPGNERHLHTVIEGVPLNAIKDKLSFEEITNLSPVITEGKILGHP